MSILKYLQTKFAGKDWFISWTFTDIELTKWLKKLKRRRKRNVGNDKKMAG